MLRKSESALAKCVNDLRLQMCPLMPSPALVLTNDKDADALLRSMRLSNWC